ncbi:MAG TPA: ATP synthase F1 subunit delta [Candidatus Aquilonibacter sp.]
MANETLARRYAEAIFSLATEAKTVESAGKELALLAETIKSDPEIHRYFTAPIVDRVEKEQTLLSAFGGKVGDLALHTLLLLVRKRRESLLDALVVEYHKLELAAQGVEPLRITTARPLSAEEKQALVERLERTYEKKFDATVRVDPSLIGGVRIAMGDRMIDGSVAGRLEELSRELFAHN